ncbi:MAG: hypothetical protein IJ300_14410 [Clostridia bacterium]|nr:hypothetical protein [Clostridia bacterium]
MMLSKTKRFTLLFLSVMLLLSTTVCAMVEPLSKTDKITLTLSFTNGQALCRGSVLGDSGTTSIIAYCTLYEVDTSDNTLSEVESFPAVSSPSSMPERLNFSHTASNCEQGKTYYLTCTAHVTVNGVTEIVSEDITQKYE